MCLLLLLWHLLLRIALLLLTAPRLRPCLVGLGLGLYRVLLLVLLHKDIVEPRVLQCIVRTDTHLGTQLQHPAQKVYAGSVDLGENVAEILSGVRVERLLVLGELREPRPCTLRRCAHDPEDANDLVLVGCAREQRPTGKHLCHDASGRPYVYACVVRPATQKNVGGAVPERHYLVGECVDRNTKSTSQTKVAEFEGTLVVDQKVLRLEIAVQDAVLVTEIDTLEQLVHK